MPFEVLAGAVLACGVLFVVAGAAKLYRVCRRAEDGGAIRVALRISSRRWRWIEASAAVAEACTGLAVCAAFHPVVAGAAMAAQAALFSAALAYARRSGATGGCACVLRPRNPGAGIGRPVQVRAAWLLAAGVVEASVRLPRPLPTTGAGIVGALAGVGVLIVMVSVERPWRTPRCGRRIWSPRRETVRALMRHGVFAAMAAAAGPFADGFSHRRDGCVDEFRFTPADRTAPAARTVAFRVSRPAPGGALAVEARIESARS